MAGEPHDWQVIAPRGGIRPIALSLWRRFRSAGVSAIAPRALLQETPGLEVASEGVDSPSCGLERVPSVLADPDRFELATRITMPVKDEVHGRRPPAS